jgi:hypothetical protein
MMIAEPMDAPNAAIAPWFQAEHHWRGVGDPRRWAVKGVT